MMCGVGGFGFCWRRAGGLKYLGQGWTGGPFLPWFQVLLPAAAVSFTCILEATLGSDLAKRTDEIRHFIFNITTTLFKVERKIVD